MTDRDSRIGSAVLVSQYFPPLNIIASQRAMRMANTLLNKFEIVYVVTLPTHNIPDDLLDLDYGKEFLNNERLKIINASPVLTGYGYVKKRNVFHRFIGAFVTRVLCSSGIDWIPSLKKALSRVIDNADVKLIVSSGGPFIPFCTVAKLADKKNIPCIIDYRDLWSQNPIASYPKIARIFVGKTFEQYVNKLATVITTVSEGCAKAILEAHPAARVKILPNYPDNSYKKLFSNLSLCSESNEFNQKTLNIVLTGTIYKECTCRLLVDALKLMPEKWRDHVIVHYYGSTSDIIEHDFRVQGMLDNLMDHGFVNKYKAIQAVKKADLLLSLVYDGPANKQNPVNGLMTTKVFDYFLSGNPILNIGPLTGDLNLLAEKNGYKEFYSFESCQAPEMAEFLLNALQNLSDFRKREIQVKLPDFSECFESIIDNVR